MIFVFFILLLIFKYIISATCNVPNYFLVSTQHYVDYLKLPYTIGCEENKIVFSPAFSIYYEVYPSNYADNISYGIISKSFSTICKLNVYYSNLKIVQISQYSLSDDQINELYTAISYFNGNIVLTKDKFNATDLKESLKRFSDLKNVVILNFLMDVSEVTRLLQFYQDNYVDFRDIYVLSYYIDEIFTHADPGLVKDTHVVSGYFYSMNTEENREFLSRFNLQALEYPNDLYFQMAIMLEFYKLIPNDFPSTNPFLNRRQLKDKEIKIAGMLVRISPLNTVDRTIFIGDIDEYGDVINILNLKTDNPFFNERYKALLTCLFVEPFQVINIGILTPINGNKMIYSFTHSIYAAIYEINKEMTLNSYLLLHYSWCNNCTLNESYSLLKKANTKILFHFSFDDDLLDIVKLITEDEKNVPYIVIDGFFTTSICNPKLIYFGLSLQEQLSYYSYQLLSENNVIFISNSTYGKNALLLLEEMFISKKNISSYIEICLDKNENKQRIDDAINNLIISSKSTVYVIVGNCEYMRLFVEDWNMRHLPNKVLILNLDQNCFKDFNQWEGFYTISKFLIPFYKNTTIYEFQNIDNKGYSDGISPFAYSVYYGSLLFARAIKITGSTNDNAFTTLISLVKGEYENRYFSFTSDNSFSSILQEAKSVGKGDWAFISESLKMYASSPISSTEVRNGEITKCDWFSNDNNNFEKKYTLYSILVLDRNDQLYDIVSSILDLLHIKSFSVYFNIIYMKLYVDIDLDIIEVMIKTNYVKFILTTDNIEYLERFKIPTFSISPYTEVECDSRIYNFGYSYTSVLSVSIAIPFELGITNYYIIHYNVFKNIDSFNEYLDLLLNNLLGKGNYNLTVFNIIEENAIYNAITNITQPSFLYLHLGIEKDKEFTKYLIEELHYNDQLLSVFHFNNRIPVYTNKYNNLKNHYFALNHPFSDDELGKQLHDYMIKTEQDSYSLYVALYFMTHTINYCHNNFIVDYENYLYSRSYKIFEEEIEIQIYNHILYSPIIIAHVVDNKNIIFSESPKSFIPLLSVDSQLSIYLGGKFTYLCSIEENGGKYYEVNIIKIGFVLDVSDSPTKYNQNMKISSKIFIDYFNSVLTQYALKLITVHFVNSTNIEDVLELFRKNDIKHIFGGFDYNILLKFIPYLEEYNMLFWYSNSIVNTDFCDKNVIPFIIPISSLNIILVQSELILFIYSSFSHYLTSVDSISLIFRNSNNEVLEFEFPDSSDTTTIDKIIDSMILSMNRDCYIVMLLKSTEFNIFVPRFKKFVSLLNKIPNYFMFTISDYPIIKNEDDIFDDIYILSGVDNLYFPEMKNTINNIYKTYNLKAITPSTTEYFTFLSFYYFVQSIQKVGYKNIKIEIKKLIDNTDNGITFYSSPSIAYRYSFNNVRSLYYLNTTLFSLTKDIKLHKNPFSCIIEHLTNYEIPIQPDNVKLSNFNIAILLERGSLDYDDKVLFLSNINVFSYFIPNMIIGKKKIVIKSYFICSNNENIESFYTEIKENIDSIDLFIGVIRNEIKDMILPLIVEHKKVMYYLYDDSGFNCSPYVFYLGLSTVTKLYPTLHYIQETCESTSIIYPLTYFGRKEYNIVIDEFKKYHILVEASFGIDEDSNLTDILPNLYKIIEGGCILNFLNDYGTVKLIDAINDLGISSKFPLISFSLTFSFLNIPPMKITHRIITYFNPVEFNPPYSDLIEMFKTTYALHLRLHRIYYNMINAVYLLKMVLKRKTNGTIEDFIVQHNDIKIQSNNYKLTLLKSHYFNHPKYIFLHDATFMYNNTNESELHLKILYQSPNGFIQHVYSHTDPYICLFNKNGFFVHSKPDVVIKIGLLYSYHGDRKIIDKSSYTTAYGAYHELLEIIEEYDDSEGIYRKILIDNYDLKSNETRCYDAMKYFIESNTTYVITQGTIRCMNEINKGNKESNAIYFITKDICQPYCNSKYVITGRYPNLVIRPIVSYFSKYLQTHPLSYILYDSRRRSLYNFADYLRRAPMNGEYYDVSNITESYTRDILSIAKRIYESPGLIITLLQINELNMFLDYYHKLLMNKEDWPIIVLITPISLLRMSIPSVLLSDIYIPSYTNSLNISNYYLMDYNVDYYDPSTYISFLLLANLIFRNLHITDLYGEIITSKVVGTFQLTDNNAVALPFKLSSFTSGVESTIYESDYLYIPDPYHTSKDERNKICVIDDVFGRIIYTTTQKYLTIGILIEDDSDYVIYLLATQVIDTVSSLVVDLKKWNLAVSILDSENELVEFINMYKETDRYEVCFLVNSMKYSTLLLDVMGDSNKTLFTTVYRPDYCKSNLISMDSYSFSSLFNIIQQFMVTYSGCRFAFYYKDEYQEHYKKLEEILATIEYTVLVSLPISSDPDILKASYNVVGYSVFPVVIFVDVDDKDVDKIQAGVTNFFTHILFQIFFFQWFEENRQYINRPYYYYYGSVYSHNSSTTINSVFSSLYHYTNSVYYTPYTLTRFFDLLKLFYVWKNSLKQQQYGSLLNVYNKAIESEFGDLILFPNNRIGSKMILSYHTLTGSYYEYLLSNFVDWVMVMTNLYTYETNVTLCDWNNEISRKYDGIRYKEPLVVTILIDSSTNHLQLSHQMAVFLYRLFSYSTYYEFGLFNEYAILPYIEILDSSSYNLTEIIDKIYSKNNLVSVFDITEIGMTDYQDLICSKEIFYFMMPLVSEYYTCRNMYDIGLSSLAIAKHIYQDVVDIVDTFIVLHDSDIDIGNNLIKYLKLLSIGTTIKFIDLRMYNVFPIVDILEYCKEISSSYSSCVMIIANLQRTAYNMYSYFENINLRKEMILYILHDDVYVTEYYRKYIDGAILLSTYVITITDPSFSKYTKTTQDFYDFIESEFDLSLIPSSILESVYTGFLILKQLFTKIDHFDYALMSKFLTNTYYDTPSGPAFFGQSRTLLRDIILSTIDVNYSFPQVESTRTLVNPSYFFQQFESDESSINIAIVIDINNNTKLAAQVYASVFNELIVTQNQIGGINNIPIILEVYSLDFTNNDTEVMTNLMENENISFVVGCITKYCHDLVSSYIANSNKLFLSHVDYPSNFCNENVIMIASPMINKILFTILQLSRNDYKDYILLVTEYTNPKVIEKYIKEYKLNLLKVYLLPIENYTSNISFILDDLNTYNSSYKIALLNLLIDDYLVDFEKEYIKRKIKAMNIMQIFLSYEDYILHEEVVNKILSGCVVTQFDENSNNDLSSLFVEMMNRKYGTIHKSQGMALYDVSLRLIISSYKSALIMMQNDALEPVYNNIDYLRRAIQTSSFDSSCGVVTVTDSNQLLYKFQISQISTEGRLLFISSNSTVNTDEYFITSTNCYYGPIIIYNNVSKPVRIIVITFSMITMIMVIIVNIFLILYHKRIRASSPWFLVYFSASGIVTNIVIILHNELRISSFTCQFISAFVAVLLINDLAVLVFRTWRIHAIYNNNKMKRNRIDAKIIIIRIFIIILLDIIISIVWGLVGDFSYYTEHKIAQKSTNIKYVMIKTCKFNTEYLLLQGMIILVILLFGFYYCWSTRNTSSDFNDSRPLAISIGFISFLLTIVFLLEISLEYELYPQYIVQICGNSISLLVIILLFSTPRFYKIFYLDKLPPEDQESVAKEVEAVKSVNGMLVGYAPDYSMPTMTGSNKQSTNNKYLMSLSTYSSTTTKNKVDVPYSKYSTINNRLNSAIQGTYTVRKGLEIITDKKDGSRISNNHDNPENENKKDNDDKINVIDEVEFNLKPFKKHLAYDT